VFIYNTDRLKINKFAITIPENYLLVFHMGYHFRPRM